MIIGGRVNGTFISKAYDDIVKELVEKFYTEINKDNVKNRQKTLKKNFHECYDIFIDGLSGFGWNDSLNIWTAKLEVWESLIASKLAAKKWMTTPMPNYSKMAQFWAKDRVKGDHAETAKEKHARYVASTTIDEIDNLISQNEVSLENFEVEDDQRSPEINVARSRMSSQDVISSKSKKRRLTEDDELGNVISQSFDNVSMEINRAIKVMVKCFSKSYGAEVHATLGILDLEPISKTKAYIFLMENPTYKEMFFDTYVLA
ncbi:uncharacterized protein LOC115974063 [Quercus lobata]|uniref:uncharacterized protein LOC115974063 n=1 Tax=Quercus lobata TaxID=97700 RepID=UPI0012440870|nr:uncharacterized protein LOC115974063 [Quercus lobata]